MSQLEEVVGRREEGEHSAPEEANEDVGLTSGSPSKEGKFAAMHSRRCFLTAGLLGFLVLVLASTGLQRRPQSRAAFATGAAQRAEVRPLWLPLGKATPATGAAQQAGHAIPATAAPPQHAAANKPMLAFGNPSFQVSELQAPVSRSVLALGVPQLLPLQKPRFEVFYMELLHREFLLEAAFKNGWPGIVWLGVRSLPFVDFAFDIVVVGPHWCTGGDCSERVLDEWLRVLRPLGKLVAWDASAVLPSIQAHPLARPTSLGNMFERASQAAAGIPVCATCRKPENIRIRHGTEWLEDQRCQPPIPANYIAVDDPRRLPALKAAGPVERVRQWFVRTENCDVGNGSSWLEVAKNRKKYLGQLGRDHHHHPDKPAWPKDFFQARHVVDAGAGTCSGAGWLADSGSLTRRLHFSYGFYDCSMARVCAERGIPILSWDWNEPLPVCGNCKFDMVVQLGGVHHHRASDCKDQAREVSCMEAAWDRLLFRWVSDIRCGSKVFLRDSPSSLPSGQTWHWWDYAKRWALSRKHLANVSAVKHSKSWQILITKAC